MVLCDPETISRECKSAFYDDMLELVQAIRLEPELSGGANGRVKLEATVMLFFRPRPMSHGASAGEIQEAIRRSRSERY